MMENLILTRKTYICADGQQNEYLQIIKNKTWM